MSSDFVDLTSDSDPEIVSNINIEDNSDDEDITIIGEVNDDLVIVDDPVIVDEIGSLTARRRQKRDEKALNELINSHENSKSNVKNESVKNEQSSLEPSDLPSTSNVSSNEMASLSLTMKKEQTKRLKQKRDSPENLNNDSDIEIDSPKLLELDKLEYQNCKSSNSSNSASRFQGLPETKSISLEIKSISSETNQNKQLMTSEASKEKDLADKKSNLEVSDTLSQETLIDSQETIVNSNQDIVPINVSKLIDLSSQQSSSSSKALSSQASSHEILSQQSASKKSSSQLSSLSKKSPQSKNSKIFKCPWPKCDFKSENKSAHLYHQEKKHFSNKPSPIECPLKSCKCTFDSNFLKNKHIPFHRQQDIGKIERTFEKIDLNTEMKTKYQEDQYEHQCDYEGCNTGFNNIYMFFNHLHNHQLSDERDNVHIYECPRKCGFTTANLIAHMNHNAEHVKGSMYYCSNITCTFKTTDKFEFEHHVLYVCCLKKKY